MKTIFKIEATLHISLTNMAIWSRIAKNKATQKRIAIFSTRLRQYAHLWFSRGQLRKTTRFTRLRRVKIAKATRFASIQEAGTCWQKPSKKKLLADGKPLFLQWFRRVDLCENRVLARQIRA